jgi:hypothetical protein
MTDIQLTGEEWEQLRQLSLGALHRDIGSVAIEKLVAAGYVTQDEDGRIELTPRGEAAVERHYARHP